MTKRSNKKRALVEFDVHNKEFMNEYVQALELSTREIHILRRAGFETVGDVIQNIYQTEDLMLLNSCGKASAQKIMICLMKHQLDCLKTDEDRIEFLKTKVKLKEVKED